MSWLPIPIPSHLLQEISSINRHQSSQARSHLYQTKEYTDVVFRLRDKEFPAYRSHLYEQSVWCREMLSRIKDNRTFSSNQSRITLPTWFTETGFEVIHSFLFGCLKPLDTLSFEIAVQVLKQSEFMGLDLLSKGVIVLSICKEL
jgi:hypothetical protein